MGLFLSEILGTIGISLVIGLLIFLYAYRYSIEIFNWIENQTIGITTVLLEKFDFLFLKVPSEKITFLLLAFAISTSLISIIIIGLLISWIFAVVIGVAVFFLSFKVPIPVVNFFVLQRMNKYVSQMVDGLTLLSNGLRAGLSVPQALSMVVEELPPPLSQEFGLILSQNKIGVPLEECFENLAKRIPLEDNQMFVTSVNILRETGGNLAEVFDTIIFVIRERVRIKQKIDTLTAQGKIQAYIIASLPFLMLLFFTLTEQESMAKVFSSFMGISLLLLAFILVATGLYIILKIVNIKL